MTTIGIDISLSSTAIFINDKGYVFTTSNTKYHKQLSNIINIIDIPKYVKHKDNSINQLNKMKYYIDISSTILCQLKPFLGTSTSISIEGYSYSSSSNNLIDIITLSTLIKQNILQYNNYTTITPMQLKSAVKKGNKTKHDMINCFIEDDDISHPLKDWLIQNKHILSLKKIPSPIDDLIDAYYLSKT